MRVFWDYLCDAGYWALGSVLAAVVFVGVGIWEHAEKKPVSLTAFVVILAILFFIGSFNAYRKQYVLNREGPELTFTCDPNYNSFMNPDLLLVENIGKEIALNVFIPQKTSWPEISWLAAKEIQSIDKGRKETVEVAFGLHGGSALYRNLRPLFEHFRDRQSLDIDISFSNRYGIRFTRTFILRRSQGGPPIIVELGKLRKVRASKF